MKRFDIPDKKVFSVGNNFDSTSTEKQTKKVGKLIGKISLTGFFSLNMNSMKGFFFTFLDGKKLI